ncbi:MAG TPA: DUF2189 domain-containing protein [Beijerinckiaceae bacterium]
MTHLDIIMPVEPRSAADLRVRRLHVSDLRRALERGAADFWAMPTHVIYLAMIYPVVGLIIGGATYDDDTIQLLYPLVAGLALLGPVAALFTYELSRRRELGLDVSWRHAFDVFRSPSLTPIVGLALLLLATFVVWVACAQSIYVLLFGERKIASFFELAQLVVTTPAGRSLVIYGNLVGALFAIVVGSMTVFSFPLLLDRNVSLPTALATSLRAVWRNLGVMAAWGAIVVGLLLVGAAPFLLGLAVVLPILGHATWHLYRMAIEPPPDARPEYRPSQKGPRYAAQFPASLFARSGDRPEE